MADHDQSLSLQELPPHLILEILNSGRLNATDLACLEQSCWTFGGRSTHHGLFPPKFRSTVDFAAFQLCTLHPLFASFPSNASDELLNRCGGNWKRVLRFLQSIKQSSSMVETSTGVMQVTTGRYHTLLIKGSTVYCCGFNQSGVLAQGPGISLCCAMTQISFPISSSRVSHISASHNHAAFVMQSGEVFTCGDNSNSCCGHGEVGGQSIFRPKLVEALKEVPCKEVATGLSFTIFLTENGQVYTCGINTHGQLGHGDTLAEPTPKLVQDMGCVIQIAAGASFSLAVTDDGKVYSFGSGSNFCLGHGQQQNEFQPREIEAFKGVHVVRIAAADEHVVGLDSSGFVYTWGKGYCGALGHGDESDKMIPELVHSLKGHLAVQVCARKRKTLVLMDDGSVFGFGWMGFGSLGLSDKGSSDKVMKSQVVENLRGHHICQISTGMYHTVIVTNKGLVLGFGDNEKTQLGIGSLKGCLKPTEIMVPEKDP
ncbi:ultraviolet-B receptor UVR8-like [Macadamia integrifolia]|uniref:ultraviolet-B receptor UVR8-like n=1 Tax=Macadamia integrifolia TaxID=60698 RepID=UPI001C4F41B5|nr:ultraviolet-B receptor UVR8-like [Macadamia integrifolia]